MNPEPLPLEAAAALIGKTGRTLRRWIDAGSLPALRVEGRLMIDPAALEAVKRTCEACGTVFVPDRPGRGARFCSDPCRWKEGNEKRKTGRPMGRPPAERTAPDPAAVPDRLQAAVNLIRRNQPPADA
jgi:hypothetical protein